MKAHVFRSFTVIAFGVIIAGAIVEAGLTPESLRNFDRDFLREGLKDTWGILRWREDWSRAQPLHRKLDYSWLHSPSAPLRIAHALGYRPTPNTVAALERSVSAGFSLAEVDLWLDNKGVLRCHHGPDLPAPLQKDDCTFEKLLAYMDRYPSLHLILDMKTDFVLTGGKVVQVLAARNIAKRIIFQLYLPHHIAIFNTWASKNPLPGPIVTAYMSHRSLNHVLNAVDRVGIKAFAFPLERAQALSSRSESVALLTHPVHSCSALEKAKALMVQGIYTTSDLAC